MAACVIHKSVAHRVLGVKAGPLACPRQLVVTAANRETIVTYTNYLVVGIHDAAHATIQQIQKSTHERVDTNEFVENNATPMNTGQRMSWVQVLAHIFGVASSWA
jgi:hypothetical protein